MRNRQNGFTLIEILIVMAVGGMMLAGLVTAIFQTFGVTKASTTQITALENIKNSAYWITRDVKKASTTNLVDGDPAVSNLTLDWTIWYYANGNLITNGEYHRCKYFRKYFLSGTELRRQHGTYLPASTPQPPIPDSSFTWEADTTVGRYISSVQFYRQGNIIAVSITSSPQEKPETAENKTYYIYLQSKEAPVQ